MVCTFQLPKSSDTRNRRPSESSEREKPPSLEVKRVVVLNIALVWNVWLSEKLKMRTITNLSIIQIKKSKNNWTYHWRSYQHPHMDLY